MGLLLAKHEGSEWEHKWKEHDPEEDALDQEERCSELLGFLASLSIFREESDISHDVANESKDGVKATDIPHKRQVDTNADDREKNSCAKPFNAVVEREEEQWQVVHFCDHCWLSQL